MDNITNIKFSPIKIITYNFEKNLLIAEPFDGYVKKIEINMAERTCLELTIHEKPLFANVTEEIPYKLNRIIKILTTFEITGEIKKWNFEKN